MNCIINNFTKCIGFNNCRYFIRDKAIKISCIHETMCRNPKQQRYEDDITTKLKG